jgi:hypothetical protein
MFAVKPRHWPANIRANAVDLIVGLSALIFMAHTDSMNFQLLWAVAYGIWLMVIKPMSTAFGIMLQALIAMSIGLSALYIAWGDKSIAILVIGTWLICYNTARHFFISFEEVLVRYLAGVWAYFGSALAWILSHWLLFYGPIAQPALLLSVIGFGLGGIYYLEKSDKMSVVLRRQIVFVMVAVVLIVLTFSNWGDKTI